MSPHNRSWSRDAPSSSRQRITPDGAAAQAASSFGKSEHERPNSKREGGAIGASVAPIAKRARFGNDTLTSEVEEGELTSTRSDGDVEWELKNEDDEEERLRDERRKRRLAILHRHQGRPAPDESKQASSSRTIDAGTDVGSSAQATTPPVMDVSAGSFELGKDVTEDAQRMSEAATNGMSAADYDASVDQELNRERETKLLESTVAEARAVPAVASTTATEEGNTSEYEEVEVTDDEDDIDDMFALVDDGDKPKKKKTIRLKKNKLLKNPATANGAVQAASVSASDTATAAFHDSWDDADGYYRITLGEHIGDNGRYQVFAILGKGMFSAVVKARDTQEKDREVAIKIIRSQESMYKAGLKEITILQRLASLDPDDKRHLVRLLGHFEHRKHLCMVFESLSMNLRDVIKRFGKDVGLNLRAVRAYVHQMILALALMRKAEIMHADLKPDNVLVNDAKTSLKVCDLGSASSLSEMEITPYLVSRFYRAPEIILGLPYDCALDMWSIGCTAFELYTGRILFPGKSNNHMLLLMQEVKGKFTTKQIRKGRFSGMHFDDQNAFVSRERDRATGADVLRKVSAFNPATAKTDLRARLLPTEKGVSSTDLRLINSFIDLLNRMLELDPARRITPTQALQHSFFS